MMPLSWPSGTVTSTKSPDHGAHFLAFHQRGGMLATHERPLVGAHERISSIKLDDLASLQKPSFESRTARLPLPFPQPIEHAQHHQSDDHHDNARNERVEVELVGMAFAGAMTVTASA